MKTDLLPDLKDVYTASAKFPKIVTIPKLKYLTIDGHGSPDKSPAFQEGITALYQLAYSLKSMLKKSDAGCNFKVMPVEALWWPPNGTAFLSAPDDWNWTVMMTVPSSITPALLQKSITQLREKKGAHSPAIDNVHLQEMKEGKAVQMLHVGPYSREEATVNTLGDFATDAGYALSGRHHEIYLSDPKRVAPEKLKTIIRYSISKAAGAAVAR
jgi:hypothetical protein